ncbi:MAG: alpha/beta hydrolase [Candidatus Coproplasma sp.]
MKSIKFIKFKTGLQTNLAHLIRIFNKRVSGVKATYNLNYCGDKDKEHALDVMSVKGENLPCVIYFHGGGWCVYDKSLFRSTAKELASCGTVVFNCNFRSAPEHSLKDMEEDVSSVVEFVKSRAKDFGGNPQKIILSGDSAGAHLLALYINKLTLSNIAEAKRFIGCAFFYGVYDLSLLDGVEFNNKEAYLQSVIPNNMPDREKYMAEYSPINYISSALPPVLICCGMVDTLSEGQSLRYISALKEKGVRAESLIFPQEDKKARHRFITFANSPDAKKAFKAFKEFIRSL